jgi:hypothetical protein
MKHLGGCLCGEVRFECDELGPAGYCHCEDCRRCTGSAFNISVRCAESAFRIRSGQLSKFTKTADGGSELSRYFCHSCGSPIFASSPVNPNVIFIKAGVLDDPSSVRPTLEAWVRSKVGWSTPPGGIRRFERSRGGAE